MIILLAAVCLAYYTLALPWLNRAIGENYQRQTGHQLQHDKLELNLFKCNLNLNHLKDSANLWQAESLHIDIACWKSLRQRSLFINSIAIGKLVANPHQAVTGEWNFADILQHLERMNKSAAAKPSSKGALPVVIKKITLKDSALHSNLLALENMPVALAPLTIAIDDIDFRNSNPAKLLIKANLNQSVPIEVSGALNLLTLTGELDVRVQQLPIVWFNSAVKPYVALELLNGAIETHSHLVLQAGVPQQLSSNGKLTDLKVRPTSLDQDAVKWKSLEWEKLLVLPNEKSIHLPLLTLNQLDGQFIIAQDRTTNVQAMLKPPAAPATEQPQEVVAGAAESQPWQFTLDRLAINNAAIGFYDQSLIPSFMVIVQQFTGEVRDISTDAQKTASIHLVGNVDGYAPVNLDGKARFFIEQPQLEALFSFKQMDMGALSPYSAEYAGWRIKKGLLSVDLDYHYDEGKIIGKNHVVISHLEFGEKVRSTRAIDIPLRVALSLLTDEKGIAVIDAEISGEPSNPKFNVRETLWRALRNSLKKVLTAPFNLLARLVNSKEDLGRIQFTPGESQLSDPAISKITLLQEALAKRPKMRLSIKGLYDQNGDLLALQEEQINSALQKEGIALESIKAKDSLWVNAINAKYQRLNPLASELSTEQKFVQLAALQVVDPERFNRLAHERAQAVKQYFVIKLGVASEILFLDSETDCKKADMCKSSEVVFTLES
ncbi:MAG TPA: DUF748 domain-containing protein [Cellvibrio sp.]|nr:DUF748 domain-containing protein [Cellvibrio sp.]